MNNLQAAILAGGASRRMGRDKSFVLINNRPMIEHVIEHLSALELATMIITNTPDKYRAFGLPCYTDAIPGSGSLGGLYTALLNSVADYVLCVACDMPFLNAELLRYLIDLRDGYDVVVPMAEGHAHSLHAVYARRCLPAIRAQIETNNLRIVELYRTQHVRYVAEDKLRQFDPVLRSLRNLNTLADVTQALDSDQSSSDSNGS